MPHPSAPRRPGPPPPTGLTDPVSLFAVPIGRAASLPGEVLPVAQTLYRTPDDRFVIRTCLHLGPGRGQACDVMVYADEDALREALSAGGDSLDAALLAAAGLDRP